MVVSVVLGVCMVPLVGKAVDAFNPKLVLPFGFFCRAGAIIMFMFIKTPSGIYSYCVSVLMVLCTVIENVTVDSLILRNADKEIRGVIYGAGSACGYFGMLVFSLVGGILFD
jgi:MFS-type transporter involved in bile tolerance (Atg22 family)